MLKHKTKDWLAYEVKLGFYNIFSNQGRKLLYSLITLDATMEDWIPIDPGTCPFCNGKTDLIDEFHVACAVAIRTYHCKHCKIEIDEIIK